MKKCLVSIGLILIGIILLISPSFIKYVNSSSWLIDFRLFVNDYPMALPLISLVFILTGGIFLGTLVFQRIGPTLIIDTSNDFGVQGLSYPKHILSSAKQTIKIDDWVGRERCDANDITIQKKIMDSLLSGLHCGRHIYYLAICSFPFAVYAGYLIGESGVKTRLYHYFRDEGKVRCLGHGKPMVRIDHDCFDSIKDNCVICVSTSHQIDIEKVKKEFPSYRPFEIKTINQSVDIVKRRKDAEEIAKIVRKAVEEAGKKSNHVILLLSCSTDICFEIGSLLRSNGLPKISIYNYDGQLDIPWNWSIEV